MASLEDAIAETQSLVGGLIKKPKMTEKLLSRPPFRFLHDIVMGMNSKTGFVDALLTAEEQDSGNIKDSKQGKLDFLHKIIAFASICMGEAIDVREAKIVAGAEALNTNILLQALAKAAMDSTIDYAAASRLALDGVPPGRVPRQGGESKAEDHQESSKKPSTKAAPMGEAEDRSAATDESKEQEKPRRKSRSNSSAAEAPPPAESKEPEPSETKSNHESGQLSGVDGDIGTTIRLYGDIIRKPKMTEKLLSRPPFRFIHDVMTSLRSATGLMEGLFQGEELDSKQCTSKEAKLGYLEKLIRFVEICSGAPVDANASRIVAGQESDKTNMLLQMLAILATSSEAYAVPPSEAVRIALGGGEAAPATEQVQLKGGDDDDEEEDLPKHNSRSSRSSQQMEPDNVRGEERPRKSSTRSVADSSAARNDAAEENSPIEAKESEDTGPESKETDRRTIEEPSDRKNLARPQTARKRPPKIRERTAGAMEKPPSRGQGAPVGVMREGDNDSDEDEQEDEDGALSRRRSGANENMDPSLDDGQQQLKSRLVRDILDDEQKQDAADTRPEANDEAKSDERPTSRGITMGKIGQGLHKGGKGKPAGVVDVDKIRSAIQLVCQSTNPLGKCMDFVHEDLTAMSKELDKWKNEYRKCCDAMEDEQRVTSETLLPLRGKLTEIDENIKDKQSRIATLKASIAKNDQRISELLRDMVLN